jgi:hypothetical protein
MSAREFSLYFQGIRQVAVATVNASGEPRAAPTDSVFLHSRFFLCLDSRSFRTRRLVKRSGVSLTYFGHHEPLVIAHGNVAFIAREQPEFAAVGAEWKRTYGRSVMELGDVTVFVRAEPSFMMAYTWTPESAPEG